MIEKNIKAWIDGTVIGSTKTIRLPYDGQRPDSNYMGYQVISVIPESHSYDVVRELNQSGLIDETRKFNASMLVSINAYSVSGYDWLNRLHASAENFASQQLLIADDTEISLVGMERNSNLTGLGDELHRPRWQGDFRFFITTSNTFEIYRLSQFVINGKWISGDKDNPVDEIAFTQDVTQ